MTHVPLLAACLMASFLAPGLTGTAAAQALHTETLTVPGPVLGPVLAEAAVTTLDKVQFLTALAKIESDIKLGVLFVFDGKDDQAALHFATPRAETIPAIAETLQSLGLVDFEARFMDLETASDDEEVKAAVKQATRELSKARLKVRPTAKDKFHSIAQQLQAAAALVNPDGPTEVADFQDSWGMVMVARDQIDLFARGKDLTLLGRTPDPVMIEGAQKLGDDVDIILIDLPDPAVPVPMMFDPAIFTTVIGDVGLLAG